jgi:hypothetical protein
MTRLVVTQTTLYGRSRLYVSDPYGARIGWVDLHTDVVVLERRDLEIAFHAAVAQWRHGHAPLERVLTSA